MRAPTADEIRQAQKDAFNASVANRGGFLEHPMGKAFMLFVTIGPTVGAIQAIATPATTIPTVSRGGRRSKYFWERDCKVYNSYGERW